MEFLKSLFTKPLSFEEFSEAATKAGIKLVDLAKGEHVAKGKLTEATDKIKALESKVSEYEATQSLALKLTKFIKINTARAIKDNPLIRANSHNKPFVRSYKAVGAFAHKGRGNG